MNCAGLGRLKRPGSRSGNQPVLVDLPHNVGDFFGLGVVDGDHAGLGRRENLFRAALLIEDLQEARSCPSPWAWP